MIISASRRTDIPAFYSQWFINRVRAGFLLTRNPFNAHQVKRVSLDPRDVDAIVFWTRNPKEFMRFIPELEGIGYRFYFQYTITGYPRLYEKSTPKLIDAISTFSELSDLIGSDRVIWRYDPIILTNHLTVDEHKRIFTKIASLLKGKTKRVVISFADFYDKTSRNLEKISDIKYQDIVKIPEVLTPLVGYMKDVATSCGMSIESCAEDISLEKLDVPHGKCIDDNLLSSIYGLKFLNIKDTNQRDACGCVKSIDIGTYNSCLHGCQYCYATFNEKVVINNRKKHDPNSPFLIGSIDNYTEQKYIYIQKTLF